MLQLLTLNFAMKHNDTFSCLKFADTYVQCTALELSILVNIPPQVYAQWACGSGHLKIGTPSGHELDNDLKETLYM